jgi:hypothetical protein
MNGGRVPDPAIGNGDEISLSVLFSIWEYSLVFKRQRFFLHQVRIISNKICGGLLPVEGRECFFGLQQIALPPAMAAQEMHQET